MMKNGVEEISFLYFKIIIPEMKLIDYSIICERQEQEAWEEEY